MSDDTHTGCHASPSGRRPAPALWGDVTLTVLVSIRGLGTLSTGSLTTLEDGWLASRGHCKKIKEETTVSADPETATKGGPECSEESF